MLVVHLASTKEHTMNWSIYVVIAILALAALACWLAYIDTSKMTTTSVSSGAGKTMCLIIGILALTVSVALVGYMIYFFKTSTEVSMEGYGSAGIYGASAAILLTVGVMLLVVNGKMGKPKKGIKDGWHEKDVQQAIDSARTLALSMAIGFSAVIVLIAVIGRIKSKVTSAMTADP